MTPTLAPACLLTVLEIWKGQQVVIGGVERAAMTPTLAPALVHTFVVDFLGTFAGVVGVYGLGVIGIHIRGVVPFLLCVGVYGLGVIGIHIRGVVPFLLCVGVHALAHEGFMCDARAKLSCHRRGTMDEAVCHSHEECDENKQLASEANAMHHEAGARGFQFCLSRRAVR